MVTAELMAKVEGLIDSAGIDRFVEAFMRICFEKADHIRSSYDDRQLANAWDRIGNRIGTLLHAIAKEGI